MYRYAEVYGGKIRDIQESHLDYVDFISIFDPKSFWLDITGQDDIQIGDVQQFDPKGGILFVHPEVTQDTPEETLEELKERKIQELKNTRDYLETEPVSYGGNSYDFDATSRDRIDIASKALAQMPTGSSIPWSTADNKTVNITTEIINGIYMEVAKRSNELHIKYRELKEQVATVTTKEELEKITWDNTEGN